MYLSIMRFFVYRNTALFPTQYAKKERKKGVYTMKKLLAILLSLLMLCTTIPFATVFAYDVPTIVAETVSEANAGDEIEVAVSLMGNPGIIGALVEIAYDSNAFELVPYVEYDEDLDEDVEYNVERATGWGASYVFFGPPGKCNMGFSNGTASKNVTKELYFTAYFKVKDNAPSGTYELKVVHNNKNFFNMAGDQVNFAAESAVITINGSDPLPPACEHKYEYSCSEVCSLCGEARTPQTAHRYSSDCDVTCNECEEITREALAEHEYWNACDATCKNCYEETNPKAKHNLVHVPAKDATCAEMGNYEYWTCEYCNNCWDNEKGVGISSPRFYFMIVVEHTLPEGIPACQDSVCSVCGQTVAGWGHAYESGNWCEPGVCIYCGENVEYAVPHETDANPACGDGHCLICGKEMPGQCVSSAAYACQDGTCIYCEKEMPGTGHEYFSDCEGICLICNEETREVAHNIVHVEAVAPTCSAMGNIEHWYCDVCGAAWLNADCTLNTNLRAIMLPMVEHTYNYPCDAYCAECGELTNESATHSLSFVEEVAATCTENGNIAYWTCEYCNGCWDNENAEGIPLNKMMTTIWAEGHVYDDDADLDCNVCGYIREILTPITVLGNLGKSVCPNVNGLAFGFSVNVYSIMVEENEFLGGAVIPFDNGEIYNLSSMGAILSNEADAVLAMEYVNDSTIKNIPALLLSDVDAEDGMIEFAVRIVNIPSYAKNATISARPYFIYSTIEGEEIVVYGDVIASSYNEAIQ